MKESIQVTKRSRRWSYVVHSDFVRNTDLSYPARMLWIVLDSFTSKEHEGVWPSTMLLRMMMGVKDASGKVRPMGKNKLFDLTKELETKGYLEKQRRRKSRGGRAGCYDSNLYILMDEPFFGLDSPSPFSRAVVGRAPVKPPPVKRAINSTPSLEEVPRGRGGGAPTSQTGTKTRNGRGAPGALARRADPGGSDSSSLAPGGANRGAAPDPVLPAPPGTVYPAELMEEMVTDDGRTRRQQFPPDEETSMEGRVGYFLFRWRQLQKTVLGRYPRLTPADVQEASDWVCQTDPQNLRSYLAMAVVAWEKKCQKKTNGYVANLVAARHSRVLRNFIRNADVIEEELSWDHTDTFKASDILMDVINSE